MERGYFKSFADGVNKLLELLDVYYSCIFVPCWTVLFFLVFKLSTLWSLLQLICSGSSPTGALDWFLASVVPFSHCTPNLWDMCSFRLMKVLERSTPHISPIFNHGKGCSVRKQQVHIPALPGVPEHPPCYHCWEFFASKAGEMVSEWDCHSHDVRWLSWGRKLLLKCMCAF